MIMATIEKAGPRLRRGLTKGSLAAAAALALGIVLPGFALANAPNPQPTTTGTETLRIDGSVTVELSGTWSWPGQACGGRYGVGWAVDWWGISSSKVPTPSFSLSEASEVLPAGPPTKPWSLTAIGSGTVEPVGAIAISTDGGRYFHVGTYYAGEDTNLCAQTTSNGTPFGSWSATATYPSIEDVPALLCVNMYDEHGSAGKSSGNPKDFSPSKDSDNSIQTNDFDPTSGGANCTASSSLIVHEEGLIT